MSLARTRSYCAHYPSGMTVRLSGGNLTAARVALEADLRRRFRGGRVTQTVCLDWDRGYVLADIPAGQILVWIRPS